MLRADDDRHALQPAGHAVPRPRRRAARDHAAVGPAAAQELLAPLTPPRFERRCGRGFRRSSSPFFLRIRLRSQTPDRVDLGHAGSATPGPQGSLDDHVQGHRLRTAARRPRVLRGDRQGRRAVRGRRAPAGAEAHRHRRHADRRRHRPGAHRLRPPGDGRGRRSAATSRRSPRSSPRSPRSTTSSSPPARSTCSPRSSSRTTRTCSALSTAASGDPRRDPLGDLPLPQARPSRPTTGVRALGSDTTGHATPVTGE